MSKDRTLRIALALFGVAALVLASVLMGKVLADPAPGDPTWEPPTVSDDAP